MTILNTGSLTLADIRNTMEPGLARDAVDTTLATNELMAEIPMIECNMDSGIHKGSVVTGLPEIYWSVVNQGVAPSKGGIATIQETCARTESFSKVHEYALEGLSPENKAKVRLQQDKLHAKAHPIGHSFTIIYGEKGVKDRYCGLAARYSAPSTDELLTGFNLIDFSPGTYTPGTSNAIASAANAGLSIYSSVYLLTFGEDTLHGIYPKGTKAGINTIDLGRVSDKDESGREMLVWKTQFTQNMGLFLSNWRYVVRGCNIDSSAIVTGTAMKGMIHGLARMVGRVPQGGAGRQLLVMNRQVRTALSLVAEDRTSNAVGYADFGGKKMMHFQGIPIVQEDSILCTETGITGTFAHL